MALTTLVNVKAYINKTDADSDSVLTSLIDRISKDISTECNRVFEVGNFTEYFDGDFNNTLCVKNYPINAITSIYDDLEWVYPASTLIDSTEYSYYAEAGVILFNTVMTRAKKNIKVQYNGGYSTIPSDLEHACILKVVSSFHEGISQLTTQDGMEKQRARREDLNKQADKILEKYRNLNYV